MAAFTASQASVTNGSKVVTISSGESVANVNSGDFLVLANAVVEINRAYIGADNKGYLELVKSWSNSNQSNQSCIVIPTTGEFKTALTALHEANALVNDNYRAMHDWQTKMGTVTFINKDKTTTTVKTLKQIEADNLAQMNAYHPHPWAMRKVEFEAIRAANNEKYAASGFVHKGKHADASVLIKAADGLWVHTTDPLKGQVLHLGRNDSLAKGDSPTDYPLLNINGVLTELAINDFQSGYNDYGATSVKFPPAEKGIRTYDSATGVSVTHATPAIAFASETETNKVVTDRIDLYGFEDFLREIKISDPSVYDRGLIQSTAAYINGVPTSPNTTRPDSYFAWYEGDTSSRGNDVNWFTITETQRIAIASDPKNKIYFDDETGKFYQRCVRGRSFAGAGNGDWAKDWGTIDSNGVGNNLSFDAYSRLAPQADKDEVSTFLNSTGGTYKTLSYRQYEGARNIHEQGLFFTTATPHECYFYVAGTQKRLNQGAHHPSFNPLGTAYFLSNLGSNTTWFSNLIKDIGKASNRLDCFDKARLSSGYLASGSSARLDGRYYDGIYASGDGGVCRDMRYSAWELTESALLDAELALKNATYRGYERPSQIRPMMTWTASDLLTGSGYWPCVKSSVVFLNKHLWETNIDAVSIGNFKDKSLLYRGRYSYLPRTATGVNLSGPYTCIVINKTQSKYIIFGAGYSHALFFSESEQVTFYNYGSYEDIVTNSTDTSFNTWIRNHVAAGDELIMYAQLPTDTSIAGEYTHTEVVSTPLDFYLCDDLKDGWIGTFTPFRGENTSIKLSRPTMDTSITLYQSSDFGGNWSKNTYTSYFDNAKNEISAAGNAAKNIKVINYKVQANFLKETPSQKFYSRFPSWVFTGKHYNPEKGAQLGYSLTGGVITSSAGVSHKELALTSLSLDKTGALLSSSNHMPTHTPLMLDAPNNNSLAFKALSYCSIESQQVFFTFAYTELKYDATAGDWGDDSKIHIADNHTTMLDENGNSVLVGTARCVEPLGWIKNDK